KYNMVAEVLKSDGVEAYPGSAALARHLRGTNMKMAVVSSSKSCKVVLKAAGIIDLFDEIVDGETAAAQKLPGKPAPDTYLKAAALLEVAPARAVVVEDAISGVQAGRNGQFGLVIGVARKDNATVLKEHGADMVVTDLAELMSRSKVIPEFCTGCRSEAPKRPLNTGGFTP
ncbi:MAG: HAD-IA family hydrolase, partial [Deltaproteobacteria bacterium]|nr:HAD-IA family hydrolase [Deltaproteobacteria bacterium]